jgi:DNA-binding CsgD family transcriptional regulator
MGIHDPEKIAKILDYSINTIYNYKARVKSKSIIPNEEFERKVMMIHAL